MSHVTDSRDFKSQSAIDDKIQFRSQCPHCNRLHLWGLEQSVTVLGPQRSQVRTCNHELRESEFGSSITYEGCGRRYVIDLRVDVKATSVALSEGKEPLTKDLKK